jgi:2-keto-4-pentenoate hydratase
MTPQALLSHYDSAQLWPAATELDVPTAYQHALAVRTLRMARGEVPCGFKIGFTNRSIWPRYNVFAPIWGTVYSTTLQFCQEQGSVALAGVCQPRIEPETVFGMRATPPANASLEDLFHCIDWIAPGFEIVQSHLKDWRFVAPDTIADGSLHARLLVGKQLALKAVASNAHHLCALLAATTVRLTQDAKVVDSGAGALVLGDPLQALLHFLKELRHCPGAPDLQPGDVVTTGTWTDAWPVAPGQTWAADFDAPLPRLEVAFT